MAMTLPQKPQLPRYEEMSGSDKLAFLWDQIIATEYSAYPDFPVTTILPLLEMAFPWNKERARRYLEVTVERRSDFMPEGRRKIVHPFGSVATCAFVAESDTVYTGIFQGAPHALIRISLAAKPIVWSLPGASLKFLVDRAPSANMLAMHSLTPQLGTQVFAKDFCNIIPRPQGPLAPLGNLFGLVSREPTRIELVPLGRITSTGQAVPSGEVRVPQRIQLRPNPSLMTTDRFEDFRDELARVPAGTVLYRVFAEDGASEPKLIGTLKTTSRFVASRFGDERLFFHHQVIPPRP